MIIRDDAFVVRPARGEHEQPDHQPALADEGDGDQADSTPRHLLARRVINSCCSVQVTEAEWVTVNLCTNGQCEQGDDL